MRPRFRPLSGKWGYRSWKRKLDTIIETLKEFPSPLGEMGLSIINRKLKALASQFPSPLGEMGLSM